MRKCIMIFIITIIIVALCTSCAKPERPLTAAELLDLGEKHLLELNFEQALDQFLKVIVSEPLNPRGYTGAAESYIGLGKPDKAAEILEQGLLVLPDNMEIAMMLFEKKDLLMEDGESSSDTEEKDKISTDTEEKDESLADTEGEDIPSADIKKQDTAQVISKLWPQMVGCWYAVQIAEDCFTFFEYDQTKKILSNYEGWFYSEGIDAGFVVDAVACGGDEYKLTFFVPEEYSDIDEYQEEYSYEIIVDVSGRDRGVISIDKEEYSYIGADMDEAHSEYDRLWQIR
ncbi:MAG: tetratricopeptide repeat protein [Clostridiales bacterium]|nr:tetratricopeptide repeat protein [Clostridiales bacterium]